ncbi:hypothetical protein [Helicobacter labetoulli]|uniref:HdrB C-terminal domain-containing protein n=1 Tax=Helicobacter labetoulli TaxID=2315333 RepID=UPI000EF74A3A|nr:hypothetical protein [Helicobacter labetoulli]
MKYIIYGRYENAKALLTSTGELFWRLQLEIIKPKDSLLDCGGYFARFVQKDVLLRNVAYNLALANSLNATLVFLEEDAYANALYAKTLIESDSELMRDIEQQFLHRFNLLYDSKVQMSYLPDLLNTINFESLIQKRFSPFSSIIVRGAYQGHLPKSTNHGLYKKIDLTMLENPIALQYYAHLLQSNSQSALYNSARLFFDLADLGIDFILTHSLSQFEMLDSKRAGLCRAYNRDNIALPIVFLPQILLLAFGENDPKKLGFNYHQQKVEMF